ncbi:hypothetical protein ACFPRL_14320 [Pseudoclavibacter helvolus]
MASKLTKTNVASVCASKVTSPAEGAAAKMPPSVAVEVTPFAVRDTLPCEASRNP